MNEELTIISERVDDTPLLIAHGERMGVPGLLSECFATHGNWQGLSLGWVAMGWLSHILSEGDHRMNHVQGWAAKRERTLSICTGHPVHALDFSDDRLSLVLRALSDDERWMAFESALNRHVLRVYALQAGQVRLDTTTASGYWSVSEEGLFQFGYSKDRRPDLPQVKVMLTTLDPFGMPVATAIVSGQRADAPLYIPHIERVRDGLDVRGLLYIGDSKMGALETRAFVEAGDDYYLCPLSKVQLPPEDLAHYLEPVWSGEQEPAPIYRQGTDGERKLIAEGYERLERLEAESDQRWVTWTESRLVIRSLRQARAATRRLEKRLAKAQTALEALNEHGRGKKRFRTIAELCQTAEAIVEKYRVKDLLRLSYDADVHKRKVRRYRERPTRVVVQLEPHITVTVDEAAVEESLRRQGWRVYATNAPAAALPLSQAVLAYRSQYIVERGCGRLKGRPLSLTPMYVERDDHATGLIRLLSIALRILTLLEFIVRRRLAEAKTELAGLYAGNPKRATARPTAERLLEAFEDITLTIVRDPQRILHHLTPLSQLQHRILELLDFSPAIYTRLCADSSKPP